MHFDFSGTYFVAPLFEFLSVLDKVSNFKKTGEKLIDGLLMSGGYSSQIVFELEHFRMHEIPTKIPLISHKILKNVRTYDSWTGSRFL